LQISTTIGVNLRNGTRLLWMTNKKFQIDDRAMSVPMTLSDGRMRGDEYFWSISNCVHTVWRRTTKFGVVTGGEGRLRSGRPCLRPYEGTGPHAASLRFFVPLTYGHTDTVW